MSSKPAVPPSDPSERLAAAQRLKEEGNAKFKDKDLTAARSAYEEAVRFAEVKDDLAGSDLAKEFAAVRVPVQLNLALCCLRTEPCEAMRALELCEEVLEAEPDNPKATYRKAKALLELGEDKEAEWELVRACKLMPKDAQIRKDLEQLRQSQRDAKAKEAATFQGLFERGPGFASESRGATGTSSGLSKADVDDIYFHDGKENPFEGAERPWDLARELQATGQLEDAAQAWEVAMGQTAASEAWLDHFCYSLEFATLLMDINIDRLALRCFNTIFERPVETTGAEDKQRLATVRRHALLMKAICLLNEAANEEILSCLEQWMCAAHDSFVLKTDGTPLDVQIAQWRESAGEHAGADSAVALGLLQLLKGQESALGSFAAALLAPEDDNSCFGRERRRSTRWNMLGAVLANRGRPEDALVAYRQALRLQPHYPRALFNLGMALDKRGDRLDAAASYAAAVAAAPVWAAGEIWAQLEQAALAQSSVDDLADAVRAKNLTAVQELLKSASPLPEPGSADTPAAEVLAQMGFA